MLIAFDTATQTASIAIFDLAAQKLLSEWTWQARRRQTQDLLATAELMLQQLDLSPQMISAIAVTTGPGSFTGVRIAISAAKGIGLGLPEMPKVVGLPTLSVTAAPFLDIPLLNIPRQSRPCADSSQVGQITVCVYLLAGRGRYNWAYLPVEGLESAMLWQPARADHISGTVDDFITSLKSHYTSRCDEPKVEAPRILLAGEKSADLEEAAAELPHLILADEISSTRRAGQLARLAAAHLEAGNASTLAALTPLYLRSP